MIQQVSPYGDLLQFDIVAGFTCMFVNGVKSCEVPASGSICRDIGLLMLRGMMSNFRVNISEILQISFMGLSAVAFTFCGCKLLVSAALEFTNTHNIIFVIMFFSICILATTFKDKY